MSNNSIHIFNFWTYEHQNELKFRTGKLTYFEWFNEDQHIAASSNLGTISIWNQFTGEKLIEYIEKTVQFSRFSLDITDNSLTIFALDQLNNLRLLNTKLKNRNIEDIQNINLIFEKYINIPNTRKIKNDDIIITSFCIYKNLIIYGTKKGHIFIEDYLSTNKNEKQFSLHNSSICHLKVIKNSSQILLISCSEDGIIISDLINELFLMSSTDNSSECVIYSDNILQTKNEIRKRKNYDINLKLNFYEKNEDQEYQLRLKEIEHKELTKTINYEAKLELTRLRTLLRELKSNDTKKKEYYNRRLESLSQKFEKDLNFVKEVAENELSNEYKINQELLIEYEKLTDIRKKQTEKLNELINKESLNQIDSEVNVYKQYKISDFKNESKVDIDSMKRKINILTESNKKMELEGDQYLEELKYRNEKNLNEVIKENDQIEIEISLAKKELNDINNEIARLTDDEINFEKNMSDAQKRFLAKNEQVENFKKILNTTTNELEKKEKNINLLKIKIDRSKKVGFINDYHIKELKSNLDPLIKKNTELKEILKSNQNQLQFNIFNRINHLKKTRDSMFNLKNQIEKKVKVAKSKLHFANCFNLRLLKLSDDLKNLNSKPDKLLELYNNFKPSIEKMINI
jgi:hypothetical protein